MQGTPQLRYSADYEVIKEQNIAEKISFLNENLPQSSCVKVNSRVLLMALDLKISLWPRNPVRQLQL